MKEIWKDIEGYEGSYQVSCLGRVRSVTRKIARRGVGLQTFNSQIIRAFPLPHTHHLSLRLRKSGVVKNHSVHRLVAKAFVPNPSGLPQVDHIDRDRTNNVASNLRWCTSSQNNHNRTKRAGRSSQYVGVSFHHKKWRAVVAATFDTELEAALAYNAAAKAMMGDFANLNTI